MHWSKGLRWWLIALLLCGGPGACTRFADGESAEAMSVENHQRAATEHTEKAVEHGDRYRPDVQVPRSSSRSDEPTVQGSVAADDSQRDGGYRWGEDTYNPTERHLRHAARHRRHAEAHAASARALEDFEELQCAEFPAATRSSCPLIGQVESVDDIPGGVRIRLVEGVEADAVIAHMRCHLAFGRANGRSGMDTCPLYLGGLEISRADSGPVVDIVSEDASTVSELRRRMRDQVLSTGGR